MRMYTDPQEWYPVHVPTDRPQVGGDEWEIPEELATRYRAAYAAFDAVSDELAEQHERRHINRHRAALLRELQS